MSWTSLGQGMRRRTGAPSSHIGAASPSFGNGGNPVGREPYALPQTEGLYESQPFKNGGNPVGNNPYAVPGTEHLYRENQPKPKPWAVPN